MNDRVKALQDMFISDGWRCLMSEIEEAIEVKTRTALDRCQTLEQLHQERGELAAMRRIVNLPDQVRIEADAETL